jgi:hypothetical protein
MQEPSPSFPTREQIDEESRQIRRLRIAVSLALQVIAQGNMPLEEAEELVSATRRLALQFFPGKDHVFDLIYGTKFRRLITAVYRLN